VFNAANEECVAAFLAGRLPFLGIVDTLTVVVEEHLSTASGNPRTVEDVLAAENWARARARDLTGDPA
jgi:1-deoxy-D-xylulose-5-phosphate reductoisomerase